MNAPLAVDGPAAPPRDNGELVFAEPWESRAFGMAVSLHDTGAFTWETFQAALITRITAAQDGPDFHYYRCWLDALQDVLASTGAVTEQEVAARAAHLSTRPAGHDHDHGH